TLNDGYSTPGNDNYVYYQGTSMATPHVAGAAALILARNPALKADEVAVLLKSTTRAFPAACSGCGRGIVNAAAAAGAAYIGTSVPTATAEVEPNDTAAQAQVLSSFPRKISGTMSRAADVDMFKVTVGAGQTLKARLISNLASNYDLSLRNATGTT